MKWHKLKAINILDAIDDSLIQINFSNEKFDIEFECIAILCAMTQHNIESVKDIINSISTSWIRFKLLQNNMLNWFCQEKCRI